MGQIRGKNAHIDACNLRSLSSFGTPAAGQHILVSTDNSATADGQGNFDAYVIGDGTKAATELELKSIADSTLDISSKNSVAGNAFADVLYTKVTNREKITTTETYTFTQGKYVKLADGKLTSAGSGWYATEDYIPINNWESIYTTATGAAAGAAVAFYDSGKTFLSGSPCGTTATVQVPDNAAFARFTRSGGSHVITTFHYESRLDLLEESQALVEQLKTDGETYTGSDLVNGVYTGDRQSAISLNSGVSWSKRGKFSIKYGDWFFLHSVPYNNSYYTFFIIDEENIILEKGTYQKDYPVKVSHPTAAYICVNQNSSSINAFELIIKKGGIANDFAQSQAIDYKVTGAEDTSGFQVDGFNWINTNGVIGISNMSICSALRSIPIKENTLFYLDSTGNTNNAYTYHITDIDGNILKSGGVYQKGFVITPTNSAKLCINCLTSYLSSFELYIFKPELANFASKVLSNKKICFMGDSITTDLYVGLPLQRTLGMQLLHTTYGGWGNLAQGNATYADQENTVPFGSDNNNYNRTISNQVYKLLQHTTAEGEQIAWHIANDNSDHSIDTSIATGTGFTDDIPDIIYIAMGTNDSASTLGDVNTVMAQNYSALDRLTLASAMRWAIETLQNVYPQARICIATAIWRGTKNIEPHNEVIREIAKRMAVPIIDAFYESGFTKYTSSLYSSDSIHPNRNGAQNMIAEYLAGKIKSLANW